MDPISFSEKLACFEHARAVAAICTHPDCQNKRLLCYTCLKKHDEHVSKHYQSLQDYYKSVVMFLENKRTHEPLLNGLETMITQNQKAISTARQLLENTNSLMERLSAPVNPRLKPMLGKLEVEKKINLASIPQDLLTRERANMNQLINLREEIEKENAEMQILTDLIAVSEPHLYNPARDNFNSCSEKESEIILIEKNNLACESSGAQAAMHSNPDSGEKLQKLPQQKVSRNDQIIEIKDDDVEVEEVPSYNRAQMREVVRKSKVTSGNHYLSPNSVSTSQTYQPITTNNQQYQISLRANSYMSPAFFEKISPILQNLPFHKLLEQKSSQRQPQIKKIFSPSHKVSMLELKMIEEQRALTRRFSNFRQRCIDLLLNPEGYYQHDIDNLINMDGGIIKKELLEGKKKYIYLVHALKFCMTCTSMDDLWKELIGPLQKPNKEYQSIIDQLIEKNSQKVPVKEFNEINSFFRKIKSEIVVHRIEITHSLFQQYSKSLFSAPTSVSLYEKSEERVLLLKKLEPLISININSNDFDTFAKIIKEALN